jgi:hypothetical protein
LRWRSLTRSEWRLVAGFAILIWCACGPPPPPKITPGSFAGSWTGRTSQGLMISFTVSARQRIKGLSLVYRCGGGSGSLTIPADVPLLTTSAGKAATLTYSSDGLSGPYRIVVRFLFGSARVANGTVEFTNEMVCGTRDVTWTATR